MDDPSQKRPRGRPSGSYSRNDATAILRMAAAILRVPGRSFRATCEAVFDSDPGKDGTANAFVSRMHYRRGDVDAAVARIRRNRASVAPVPDDAAIGAVVRSVLGRMRGG